MRHPLLRCCCSDVHVSMTKTQNRLPWGRAYIKVYYVLHMHCEPALHDQKGTSAGKRPRKRHSCQSWRVRSPHCSVAMRVRVRKLMVAPHCLLPSKSLLGWRQKPVR